MKSCTGCVHYRDAAETVSFFKKDLAAPVCAKLERMLAKPGALASVAEALAVKFGEECEHFSTDAKDAVTKPLRLRDGFEVTTADPDIVRMLARNGGETDPSARAATCLNCQHYVEAVAVKDELGWTGAGLCAASGRLILSGRGGAEATGCTMSVQGTPRDTTAGLHELPEYNEGFVSIAVGGGVGGDVQSTPDDFIEPTEYPSDRPVTDDEAAWGIRAIRRVYDPKGSGRYVEVPVWRIDFFTEEEQERIPRTGDDEHPEWYVDHDGLLYKLFVAWFGADRVPLLIGEAGTGKTELLRKAAWIMCCPFERLNIRGDTELNELIGGLEFSVPIERRDDPTAQPVTWWRDGVVPRRWENVGVLCADEFNMGPVETEALFRSMIDSSAALVVDDRNRDRNPYCFLGFTANPDWKPAYVGTKPLSGAFHSRTVKVQVDLPPEHIEREIIVKKCLTNCPPYVPPTGVVDRIMLIAQELRSMNATQELPVTWAIREQQTVLALTQYLDLFDAYRMAVTDGLEPETAQMILNVVNRYNA